MEEATKKIFLTSLQDQSCIEKSTAFKPFSFMAPNKLFEVASSSFKVRENPLGKGLGDTEESTNLELDLKLATSNTYSTQATDNHNNHTFDKAEKDLINGSFVTHTGGVNINTNQTCEGQASESSLDLKWATEMKADPKRLKRIMANRTYSKNYRLKKMVYINHLEKLTDVLRLKMANIRLQIEENKSMQQSLLIVQHQLKLQIATYEKDRIVKEVEIGKNMVEVNRLRELQINQLQGKEHPMRNSVAGLQAFNAYLDINL